MSIKRWLNLVEPCDQFPRTFFVSQADLDALGHFVLEHVRHVFAQVFLDENAVTLVVDLRALFIQHIIIFKQMLADIKVRAFHTGLRTFDDIADKAHFQRKRVIHLEAFHQSADLVAAEHAHQVILQGEIKTRRARVTLTGGTTAQLVINTARFVTFRADDMQAAQFLHTFHIFKILQEEFYFGVVNAIVRRINFQQSLTAFFESHVKRVGISRLSQNTIDRRDDILPRVRRRV